MGDGKIGTAVATSEDQQDDGLGWQVRKSTLMKIANSWFYGPMQKNDENSCVGSKMVLVIGPRGAKIRRVP
jgi:hypothetical protein